MKYEDYIASKRQSASEGGIDVEGLQFNPMLKPFQLDIVKWALRKGRAAIFADCGLGKTLMQLEWANHIPGPVLILAPLAVAHQTVEEAEKFGIPGVTYSRSGKAYSKITITNYEMLDVFDVSEFAGVVLDESSILKNFTGKMRNAIIDSLGDVRYKLACTATPSPNDYAEIGNHSEFLGYESRTIMLSKYFINDSGDTGSWRLKGHAIKPFWEWVASWAVGIGKPSDLGHNDDGYILPPLNIEEHFVAGKRRDEFALIPTGITSATELYSSLRLSLSERCELAASMVNESDAPWIVWCHTNDESALLAKLIPDAVEVIGSDSIDEKERKLDLFSHGKARVIITKPKIAGLGLNWQHCANICFVSITYSYESIYQAIRRSWRFGQTKPVNVHIIVSEDISGVRDSIRTKEAAHAQMQQEMVEAMRTTQIQNVKGGRVVQENTGILEEIKKRDYIIYRGDAVQCINAVPDNSIHFSVFSPPFASLFTYSDNIEDMGNSLGVEDFMIHFGYLIDELYRVIMPGRLTAIHCMNLITTKWKDGVIGLQDFRGEIIRAFQARGFIYHSEVCIWKDPLVQATRTKILTLAHKQISKDAAMCGQGLPDYLVIMRKPGVNPEPVAHGRGFENYVGTLPAPDPNSKTDDARTNKYSHEVWQRYASPVWFDIDQTHTLNIEGSRESRDERHICPLQLDVIERALHLWTNPGDMVLSPFMGIGSEGYSALRMGRRFTGIELKESYFKQAAKFLAEATKQGELF